MVGLEAATWQLAETFSVLLPFRLKTIRDASAPGLPGLPRNSIQRKVSDSQKRSKNTNLLENERL